MGPTGATGATGLSSTITIGTTTTGYPGTNAIVSNSGTSNSVILNFTIPRGADGADGAKGDKGDKGDKGNNGADGASVNIGDVVSLVLSAIGFGALQSQISTLSGTVIGIEGEIITIQAEIDVLQLKTNYLSTSGTSSRFTSPLLINNGVSDRITLNQDGTSQFLGAMSVSSSVSGTEFIAQSALSFTNNVGIIGYQTPTLNIGNSSLNTTTNIGGVSLNIGNDLSNTSVNIGGGLGIINLNGSVINLNGLVSSINPFNFSGFFNQMV
jgi:hypothetical protein